MKGLSPASMRDFSSLDGDLGDAFDVLDVLRAFEGSGGVGGFFDAAELVVVDEFGDGGVGPQTGQSGFLRSLRVRKLMPRASTRSRRPTSGSPMPRMSLMTSVAWMMPTRPGRMPRTPPSAQDGTRPGGGGSG